MSRIITTEIPTSSRLRGGTGASTFVAIMFMPAVLFVLAVCGSFAVCPCCATLWAQLPDTGIHRRKMRG
jgi:hypothetical protein